MAGVKVESKRLDDKSKTDVSIGSLSIQIQQVGNRKIMLQSGRGNVRQAKALARQLHKLIQ